MKSSLACLGRTLGQVIDKLPDQKVAAVARGLAVAIALATPAIQSYAGEQVPPPQIGKPTTGEAVTRWVGAIAGAVGGQYVGKKVLGGAFGETAGKWIGGGAGAWAGQAAAGKIYQDAQVPAAQPATEVDAAGVQVSQGSEQVRGAAAVHTGPLSVQRVMAQPAIRVRAGGATEAMSGSTAQSIGNLIFEAAAHRVAAQTRWDALDHAELAVHANPHDDAARQTYNRANEGYEQSMRAYAGAVQAAKNALSVAKKQGYNMDHAEALMVHASARIRSGESVPCADWEGVLVRASEISSDARSQQYQSYGRLQRDAAQGQSHALIQRERQR